MRYFKVVKTIIHVDDAKRHSTVHLFDNNPVKVKGTKLSDVSGNVVVCFLFKLGVCKSCYNQISPLAVEQTVGQSPRGDSSY